MSLTRSFFREFRPLFRMLEEPLTRPPVYFSRPSQGLFDDPFFQSPSTTVRPPVDVTEEGNAYIVEAELPGVQKDNVEVRIGDGGRSLTIEGKVLAQRREPTGSASASTSGEGVSEESSANQISSERAFSGRSTFTRTLWLPRPVDGSGVTAQLKDGILTVKVPKAEDKASMKVPVE